MSFETIALTKDHEFFKAGERVTAIHLKDWISEGDRWRIFYWNGYIVECDHLNVERRYYDLENMIHVYTNIS